MPAPATLETVPLADLAVTRLVIGGNPFSGFSHQGDRRDDEMLSYYTVERIKETLRKAEAAGVTALFARADRHVARTLREYWEEGGTVQWVAQTASEEPDPMTNIPRAHKWGAKAIYLHGGQTDYFLSNDQGERIIDAIKAIRDRGLPAGVAGHRADDHDWVREHVDCDFQMCCYYNSSDRANDPAHHASYDECFDVRDRDRMMETIARMGDRPVVHYKILAAGRTPPDEAFRFAGRHMRPHDLCCVGVYLGDKPDMIDEDIDLFNQHCTVPSPA